MKLIVAIVAFAFFASPVKADDLSDLKARLKVLEEKAGIKTIAASGPGVLGSTPTVIALKPVCQCGATCPCVAVKAAAPSPSMYVFDGVPHQLDTTTNVYRPVSTAQPYPAQSFSPQSFSIPMNYAPPQRGFTMQAVGSCANGKCSIR